jgi:hypothetical protein
VKLEEMAKAAARFRKRLERDLDTGLGLSGRTFGLALCLGVLYHLKNPFGFLEELARRARYCLLSTRIAQVTPGGTAMAGEPLAYLPAPFETNHDASNYWIFSEAGLQRLFDRTAWDLCDYTTTGAQTASDPRAGDRDQRAFALLRSKLPDPWAGIDLDGGWHEMEEGSWRWTERAFSVRSKPGGALRLRFRLPEMIFDAIGPVKLRASVGEECLPECRYDSPVYRRLDVGRRHYRRK